LANPLKYQVYFASLSTGEACLPWPWPDMRYTYYLFYRPQKRGLIRPTLYTFYTLEKERLIDNQGVYLAVKEM
jgi:hypothetical protein